MPAPLFSFVWQYSNQPIATLADDITQFVTNPTSKVVPVCADTATTPAGEFVDSCIWDDGQSLRTIFTPVPGAAIYEERGLKFDFNIGVLKYQIGDFNAIYNGTSINIGDLNGLVRFNSVINGAAFFGIDFGNSRLEMTDGLTATTAGSAAAKFIKVRIGSTDYKIQLLSA